MIEKFDDIYGGVDHLVFTPILEQSTSTPEPPNHIVVYKKKFQSI